MRFFTIILNVLLGGLFLFSTTTFAQNGTLKDLREEAFTSNGGTVVSAELGTLEVPENRAKSGSHTLSIPYIRLKSTAEEPGTPLVYLSGGPGSSCTWMAEDSESLEQWVPLLAISDIILFDQRGTGAAAERLTWINFEPLAEDLLVSEAAAAAHFEEMSKRALVHWQENEIDINGYTTLESAKDLEALRQALKLPQISILGFSYGTHLGQAYLKYFSESVEKAILIGVEGLGETFKQPAAMDAQFYKIAQLVASDSEINKEIPDLVELYQDVSQQLAKMPVVLKLRSPLTGEEMEVKVGKFGLDFILFCDIGDTSDLPIFPRLLYTMNKGDYSIFEWFVQKRISMGYGLQAMATTMDIVSGGSAARKAMIAEQVEVSLFGNVVNTPYLAMSESWPVPELGRDYRAGFSTQVPVLLLSGSLDFNTPPYQAEQLRWHLHNAEHIVVKNAGHEQIITHPRVGEAIGKFLMGEAVDEITASYPPLQFIPLTGPVADELWHPALGE